MSEQGRLSDTLAGRRVVVAAERKAEEAIASLQRHGAEVVQAAPLSVVPHADDAELLARTRELLAAPPQVVVATTGVGFRGWLAAADAAGLGESLREALARATLLARGTKARGAIRQAGLTTAWVAESETAAEVGEHLRTLDLAGQRVAIQHHGSGADGLDELCAELGAEVTSLTIYRWGPPADPAALERAVREAGEGTVDAVLFTSAPGVVSWLEASRTAGTADAQRERAATGCLLLAAVGPVTAAPLQEEGFAVMVAERSRLGALLRDVVAHYA